MAGPMNQADAPRPFTLWTYRRAFDAGGHSAAVVVRSTLQGNSSELLVDGRPVAIDATPAAGPDSVRNHRLDATLPDGRALSVEAGYINWLTIGIAARIDGRLIHESHPGRAIALPDRAQKMMLKAGDSAMPADYDPHAFGRNKVPLAIDITLGLLFFVVAKLTDLTTAALIGAGAGLALVVAQRFTRTDLLGGLALFGIVMLLVSAGLAIAFQDDDAIKLRSTVVGLIGAAVFITDGLAGGKWVGRGLSRYLPYKDIDTRRLALGMGGVGLVMAGLNVVVVRIASTDVWLFYTTFVDIVLSFAMVIFVMQWARRNRGVHIVTPDVDLGA